MNIWGKRRGAQNNSDKNRGFTRFLRGLAVSLFTWGLWMGNAHAVEILPDGTFALDFHFQYLPDAADIEDLKLQVERARLQLCDSTEGAVRISQARITVGNASEESGDVWLLTEHGRSHSGVLGGHVTMYREGGIYSSGTIAHELGHLLLGLGDSYDEQIQKYHRCGFGYGFDPGWQQREVNNSLMQSGASQCRLQDGRSLGELNPLWGVGCVDDASCSTPCEACAGLDDPPASITLTCDASPAFASELSVALNFDLLAGDGAVCPAPKPGAVLEVAGYFNPNDTTSGRLPYSCGNGVIEPELGEQCEPTVTHGLPTCLDFGLNPLGSGLITCNQNCTFSKQNCQPVYIADRCPFTEGQPEACDAGGQVPSGLTCESFGLVTSGFWELDCRHCSLDLTDCSLPQQNSCGNGIVEPELGEQCDPGDESSPDAYDVDGHLVTCDRFYGAGHGGQTVKCSRNCTFDKFSCNTACETVQGSPEACTGAGGKLIPPLSCQAAGFEAGESSCTASCSLSLSSCGRSIDVSSFDTIRTDAQAVSPWLQVVDGMGEVHLIRLYARRIDAHIWHVHVVGLSKEYVTSAPTVPVVARVFRVEFDPDTHQVVSVASGRDAAAVAGHTGTFTLGGPDGVEGTPAFVAGVLGQAGPLTLSADFAGLLESRWQQYFDAPGTTSGGTRFSAATRVVAAGGAQQLAQCTDPTYCELFNTSTQRWEGTGHRWLQRVHAGLAELRHAGLLPVTLSEHGLIPVVMNYKYGITVPETAQVVATPLSEAACGGVLQWAPETLDVDTPDGLVMVIDRSGSMITRVDAPFTFGKGDGETRMNFAKAAARQLIDEATAYNPSPRAGLVSFSAHSNVVQTLAELTTSSTPGVGQVTTQTFKSQIDTLSSGGATAIGVALEQARTMLAGDTLMAKAIILVSDGENNSPEPLGIYEPLEVAQRLAADGIRVFTVPTGNAADKALLSQIAAITGGAMFFAPSGDELPATFHESYARASGEGLALIRTPTLSAWGTACDSNNECPSGGIPATTPFGCRCRGGGEVHTYNTLEIPVNRGAQALDTLISARNSKVNTWQPVFQLVAPNGQVVLDHTSPEVVADAFYRRLKVELPAAGLWKLHLAADHPSELLASYVQAYVKDPKPECYAQVKRGIVKDEDVLVISAQASYGGRTLSGAQIYGRLVPPWDGNPVDFELSQDDAYGHFSYIVPTSVLDARGVYGIYVGCSVPEGADYVVGEGGQGPLDGDEYSGVPAFWRAVQTGIFLDIAEQPELYDLDDCDADGIDNGDEPDSSLDTDGDGLPDICDEDDDNDDIPDLFDPDPKYPNDPDDNELDNDGVPSDIDNCSYIYNPQQEDFDADGIGDACDENSFVADAGPDQLVECEANGSAFVLLDGTASGAPQGSLDYSWTSSVTLTDASEMVASGMFPVGQHTVELTVSQGSTQQSDITQITVVDTTVPVILAPPTVFAATCGSVNLGQASATDSCGSQVLVTNDAPTTFRAGATKVTWFAMDAAGNIAQDEQLVVVDLGNDPACCPIGSNIIVGNSNNNVLNGTSGRDCILGLGGQDTINGFGGDDVISGGDGNDVIYGGAGHDFIHGGTGQDTIHGGVDNDVLRGGDGVDVIHGGDGDDILSGGQGQDQLFGEGGNDQLYGDDGEDTLWGGDGDDFLNGGGLHDICDGGAGTNRYLMCENVPDTECHTAIYEAETMYHSTGGATTDGWNLWSNGYVSTSHDFTEGPAVVTITAKGEQGGGQWPHMRILVGGNLAGQFTVDQTAWTTYVVSFSSSSATQEIRVEFDNDYNGGSGNDRNLLLDKVSVACGSATTAVYSFELGAMGWTNISSPGVTSSIDGTRAFDGTSSLRLDINGSGEPAISVAPSVSPSSSAVVTMQVFVPAGAPVAAISPYVLDANWIWSDGYTSSLTPGSWQSVAVTVPSGAVGPLNRIGVKVYLSGPYSGPIYVDAVDW